MDNELLQALADDGGYDDTTSLLEDAVFESVVPAICTDDNCGLIQESEPDARANYCEECGQNTVKSCLVIAGVI